MIKELKDSFRHNGLLYTLIDKNEKVAIFGIGGTYTDEILHWEVCRIQIRKDKYGERQSIPQNELFGKEGSKCFANRKLAFEYFDKFSNELCQGVPEVVSGDKEYKEVKPEYQDKEILEPCY